MNNYNLSRDIVFYRNSNNFHADLEKKNYIKNFHSYTPKGFQGNIDNHHIDSIVFFENSSSIANKLEFFYSNEKISEILWFSQNELFMRIRYFYKNTLLEKILYEFKNNNSWQLDSEIDYFYDNEDLLKGEIIKTNNGADELIPWIKTSYNYSVDKKLEYYVDEIWKNENWLISEKAFFEYSEVNNLISILFYKFIENNWQESSLALYNYDENYLKEILFSAYDDSKWRTIAKSNFSYQDFNEYKSKIINAELFENNHIIDKIKFEYHYDTSDFFLSCKVERQFYNDWISTIYPISIDNPDGFEFHILASEVKAYYNNKPTVVSDKNEIPNNFLLYQNYPNPFNPSTTIKYSVPGNEKREMKNVKITVYDVLGNEVATLVNEQKPAGNYEVKFDGNNLASGVFFYCLKVGSFSETKKMLLMK